MLQCQNSCPVQREKPGDLQEETSSRKGGLLPLLVILAGQLLPRGAVLIP